MCTCLFKPNHCRVQGEAAEHAVTAALAAGYRHIDTAAIYRNEEAVARGIAASGVPRAELFITSKLQPKDHGAGAYDAALASLSRLGTDYLDLVWAVASAGV
jgi:2,5-diketo-D-gluconate reductase A